MAPKSIQDLGTQYNFRHDRLPFAPLLLFQPSSNRASPVLLGGSYYIIIHVYPHPRKNRQCRLGRLFFSSTAVLCSVSCSCLVLSLGSNRFLEVRFLLKLEFMSPLWESILCLYCCFTAAYPNPYECRFEVLFSLGWQSWSGQLMILLSARNKNIAAV